MYGSLHIQRSSPLWNPKSLNLEMMNIHSHSAHLCAFVLLEDTDVFLQKRSKDNNICKAGTAQSHFSFFHISVKWIKTFAAAEVPICPNWLYENFEGKPQSSADAKHQKHSDTSRLQQRRISGEKAFSFTMWVPVVTQEMLQNMYGYIFLTWTVKIKIIFLKSCIADGTFFWLRSWYPISISVLNKLVGGTPETDAFRVAARFYDSGFFLFFFWVL